MQKRSLEAPCPALRWTTVRVTGISVIQGEGHCQRGQPQASPMEVPSPREVGQAGFQFSKPKEEEFQGPPELSVDTQIHPVSDLPNPAVSHPAASAVINHTHQSPTGTPCHHHSQRNHFSASPTQSVLSMTGAPQASCACQWPIWFPGFTL